MFINKKSLLQPILILLFTTCSTIYLFIYFKLLNTAPNTKPPLLQSLKSSKPGGFIAAYYPNNNSYCDFNPKFGLPHKFLYNSSVDLKPPPQLGWMSPYRVLETVIRAQDYGELVQVTYTTHFTPEFFGYFPEIIRYWEGPISAAVFVTPRDCAFFLRNLVKLCYCYHQMQRVTLSVVFPRNYPLKESIPQLGPVTNCALLYKGKDRRLKGLIYPINVCRNVASKTVTSPYQIISDIQLVPSENLAKGFRDYLRENVLENFRKFVFVVPVFELIPYHGTTAQIPRTKNELRKLIKTEKATYFHRYVCVHCQKFPGLFDWLRRNPEKIQEFERVKREAPYQRWEPIYIGTGREPLYAEGLSWEGLQDKMPQMLEMCLMKYTFVILDGGFLVHWPEEAGRLKKRDFHNNPANSWRTPFKIHNSFAYKKILRNLIQVYGNDTNCGL